MAGVPRIQYQSFPFPVGTGNGMLVGFQLDALLASEGHWRLANGAWSSGGPFYVIHESLRDTGTGSVSWTLPQPRTTHYGGVAGVSRTAPPMTVSALHGAYGTYGQQTAANAAAYATGWSRTRPGNPLASTGQFLIELRQMPQVVGMSLLAQGRKALRQRFYRKVPFSQIPREAKSRIQWFRSLGNEYLNVEFGWKPFVRDLQDIYRLMKNIDKEMAQIVRDNNRGVRRGCSLGEESNTTGTSASYNTGFANVSGAPPNYAGGHSYYSVTTTTKKKSWYVAQYCYHIPDTSSWQWNARARAALFGVLPTPALLWEVLPWSWLIDWFSNVGDVVSNASLNAVDNLVARYSYVMTSTSSVKVATSSGYANGARDPFGFFFPRSEHNCTTTRTKETKVRIVGTPYGLGVKFDSLSGKQLGILAALGLSRSNF